VGCPAWAYALWPFGVWASVAAGAGGAVAGLFGPVLLARLEERALAEGGVRRWAAVVTVLVALWLAVVIVPSIVGAAVRSHRRL
jgi:hypothetical protein